MSEQPTIQTEQLVLRPYSLDDAPGLQRLIGDRDIADTTAKIPHPYEDGMAEEWIGKRQESFEKGETVSFAITNQQEGFLMGGIGLRIDAHSERAEIGYWIGKPYWGHGYCTEAAKAILRYGFEVMRLNRIHSRHFTRNPASGRVMQKIGMKYEGCRRQHFKKWNKLEDVAIYGILRSEYEVSPDS
jgi:ribosomal-protein-alanine N-acetyltransferase